MILSENEIRKILEPVLAENPGKEIGISVSGSETGSTRFANNAITTNGVYNRLYVTVQANRGQKSGVVQINEWSIEKVREALGRAEALAAVAPENEEFMPLPGPQTYIGIPPVYFASTARCAPERRAQAIAAAVESAKARNLVSAGFFETSSGFTCHLNSKGLFYHYPTSRCYFSTTMRGEGGSGWAAAEEEDFDKLPIEVLIKRAMDKSVASKDPERVQPGKYTVILEPAAVTDLLWWLLFNFGAREADEGRSFLAKGEGKNRLGDKLFSSRFTVTSDPSFAECPSLPIGEDGLSQTKTVWIEKGIVRHLNYTRFWAQKMKTEPVSFPANLVMTGGDKTMADLIRSTENGILVSRLWYIRDLNPMILLLTGLTRDGVFRIENGKITRPINNFRFNESPVQVFKNIVDMAKPERAVGGETGMSAWVPALKVKEFTFSSISEAV